MEKVERASLQTKMVSLMIVGLDHAGPLAATSLSPDMLFRFVGSTLLFMEEEFLFSIL